MAVLIYHEQAGDKLKLLAEVGEDNVELAVDALLDAEPKLVNMLPFVVFPAQSRMIVAVGEIVRPRRDIQITGGDMNGQTTPAPKRRGRPPKVQPEATAEVATVEAEPAAPVRATRKRAAKKPAAVKRGPGRPKGSKNKTPFTRNPASDE